MIGIRCRLALGMVCSLTIVLAGLRAQEASVGLDKVPSRDQWKPNPPPGATDRPAFLPEPDLQPHLIEKPIIVRV